MPKGSRGGRRSSGGSNSSSNPNSATQGNSLSGGGGGGFTIMSDADAQQIRDDVDKMYSPSVRDAIKQYIADDTKYSGNKYSMSQTMNHKLNNGLPLSANEQYMVKYMQKGMHDMGKDVVLERGCHEDFLQGLGIKDYTNMSESQLKSKLVGTEFKTKSFSSFSYNTSKNPFLGGPQSGGREVVIKQNTKSGTKVIFGAKSQSEIITNIGTESKITNVYFAKNADGSVKTARPKGSMTRKPVVIIETTTK